MWKISIEYRKCGVTVKGQFFHNIDGKGRLAIPVKFREELGASFVVTKEVDGCLAIYSDEEWKKLEDKFAEKSDTKSRQIKRFLFSGAADCEPDSQGRIIVPAALREFASLEKEVAIIGVSKKAEIWNAEKWEEYNVNVTPETVSAMMEEMDY